MRHILTAILALIAMSACSGSTTSARFETEPHLVAPGAVGTPQFLFGAGGDIEMIVAIEDHGRSRLDALTSRNGGDTFRDLGPITEPGTDVDAQGENAPRFAMDRDELLYALWRQDEPSPQILLAVHDWRIGKYAKAIAVRDAGARGFAGYADLAVGADGTTYVVWLDERDQEKSGDSSAVYFASLRGGRVSRNIRIASSACACCRPAVAVAGDGTIYVAWRHDDHDLRDIALAASHDGGRSFSSMRFVARDGWRLHGCPESGPSLLAAGRRLYVAWYTQRGDARSRVLLSSTDDDGKTFVPPVDVSQATLDANHPRLIAMKPSGIGVTFEARDPQARNGWSVLVPYLAVIDQKTGSVSAPLPLVASGSTDAMYPYAVARDANSLFVSYTLGNRAVVLRGRVER
jgi:hypothetical protein